MAPSRLPSVLAHPCPARLLRLVLTPRSLPHCPWQRWLFLMFSQVLTFVCQDRRVLWLLSQTFQGLSSGSVYASGGPRVRSE